MPPRPDELAADDLDPTAWLHPGVREVHRDDVLWVLSKPAGVLSHPNPPASEAGGALLRAPYDAERELFRLSAPGRPQQQVHLLHRLDRETSGLILCALEAGAAASVRDALFRREVEKEYRALVLGVPRRDEGEWEDALEKRPRHGRLEVRVRPRGRPNAASRFRVVERLPRAGLSLLELVPRSGRTHQLRVQAASRGLPLAGDERYGDFTANRFLAERAGLERMFLHASRLVLRHPVTGERLECECPLDGELDRVVARLRDLDRPVPRRKRP